MPILTPSWSDFSWEVRSITSEETYLWYDDWVSRFPRAEEIHLVQEAIRDVSSQKKRIHIRGVSTRESIDMLREYYADCGYEDALAKNYTLPQDELLTVSISLGHGLWCAKDKHFLSENHHEKKCGHIVPPLRTPADLRTIQQALRMGIIMGIEVAPIAESYLAQLLEKQILSVFQIGQMVAFRWLQYGFTGEQRTIPLVLPDFSWEIDD